MSFSLLPQCPESWSWDEFAREGTRNEQPLQKSGSGGNPTVPAGLLTSLFPSSGPVVPGPFTCLIRVHDIIPSIGCASCSDPNPSGPYGPLSMHQPPHLEPAPPHIITAPFPRACEDLLTMPPPLPQVPWAWKWRSRDCRAVPLFASCCLLWFLPCLLPSPLTSARRLQVMERQRCSSPFPWRPCLLLQEGLVFQQMF